MLSTIANRDPINRITSSWPWSGNQPGMAMTPFSGGGALTDPFNQFGALSMLPNVQNSGAFRLLRQLGISELVSCDIVESPTDYHIVAELPGVPSDCCQISLDGNVLTISADRKSVFEEDDWMYHKRERVTGRVERAFELPIDAVLEKGNAKFLNGVLTVSFPKTGTPQGQGNRREIPITGGEPSGSTGRKKK